MSILLGLVLLGTLLVGARPAGALPPQFRLYDGTRSHTVSSPAILNFSAPPNWSTPVNYAGGRAFLRFEVTAKPSTMPMAVQMCMWRNQFVNETCTGSGTITTTGVYWIDLGRPSSWWVKDGVPWSWSEPIQQISLMIKDPVTNTLVMTSRCGVKCYTGTEDLTQHTPLAFHASVLVVAQGASLDAPARWAGCPSSWSPSCTGAAVNRPPVANAGPDRTVAAGSNRTVLEATVEDDGLGGAGQGVQWSKRSGPGTVTFSAPTNPSTTATFDQPGRYVLTIRATDGVLATLDDVTVDIPDGTFPPAPRTVALVVSSATTPTAPDRALRNRLTGAGWTVNLVDDNALTAAAIDGASLVVVSASVTATLVPAWLGSTAVPLLSNEVGAAARLRLGGSPSLVTGQTQLSVTAGHPVAAGLTGTVTTSTTSTYSSLGTVATGATVTAQLLGSNRPAVFSVETGAALTTGVAPARRVGFFLAPSTASALRPEGWSLFDAAVQWLVPEGPTTPTPPAPVTVAVEPWWNAAWAHRLPLTVTSATAIGGDAIAEVGVDFTSVLSQVQVGAALDPASLRVIEVDAVGTVLDAAVPFQFDPAPGFEATAYAVGTLTVQLAGGIPNGTSRRLHVYFDTPAAGHTAATVAPQVTVESTTDVGRPALKITTAPATWYLQTENGGLSSLVDAAGMDWLNFNTAPRAAGMFRGMPNAVFPEGGFHPGFTGMTTTVLTSGPLKASVRSVSRDGWRARWDFLPGHATMTFEQTPTTHWFLYEGTPGGQIDATTDRVIYADGTNLPLNGSRSGDLVGPEWVGFADTVRDRSLFVHHTADDTHVDSYSLMQGAMTVFGFGRDGLFPRLFGERTFRMGLLDGSTHAAIGDAVAGAARPVVTPTPTETQA
jgi:hypothetical protein